MGQGRHPLPSAERFAAAASRAGIGPGVTVVAYGTLGGAERLWWLLRHFGHDDCAVLIGGIDAWGGPLRAGRGGDRAGRVRARGCASATRSRRRISLHASATRRSSSSTRGPANRWRGEPNLIDTTPGRIPGAHNAPWAEPQPELPEGELVAYCGSGVTACVVLHRAFLRGREGRLYPGSWSDWSARGLPLEQGLRSGAA